MGKNIGNKNKNLFVITFLVFWGINIGYTLGVSFPMFINRIRLEHNAIYIGFLINYGIMLIETILATVGVFFLLKNRRKNIFLSLSLLVICFEYIVSGIKFTFLPFELGFTFSFGQIGLGINFIGLILLVWYLKLKDEEIKKPSVNVGA